MMEDMMSIEFDSPVDLVITDPCYLGHKLPGLMNEAFQNGALFKDAESVELDCSLMEAKIKSYMKKINGNSEKSGSMMELLFGNGGVRGMAEYIVNRQCREPIFWAPMKDGLEEIGFTRSLMGYTVFGDWVCGVFRGADMIGRFSSESGMYCVVRRDELEATWPEFSKWHEREGWKAAIVHGFAGTVKIVAARQLFAVNENGRRKLTENLAISIEGIGDDDSMDFRTCQTGE